MADKLPWFPFYGRDFFGDEDVKLFTARQIGFYMCLLWHQWEHGSIPSASECEKFPLISRAIYEDWKNVLGEHPCGSGDVQEEIKAIHGRCFVKHPTIPKRFYNPRLEVVRKEQEEERLKKQAHALKASRAAKAKRGDPEETPRTPQGDPEETPRHPNQNQNQNQSQNQISSLSSSSSESLSPNSSPVVKKKKEKIRNTRASRLASLDAFTITPELRFWAMETHRVEIPDHVLREFKDRWREEQKLRTDWDATFRNRIDQLVGWGQLKPKPVEAEWRKGVLREGAL